MKLVVRDVPSRRLIAFALWLLLSLALMVMGSEVIRAQTPPPDVEPAQFDGMSSYLAEELAAADAPVSFLVILKDQLDLARISVSSLEPADQGLNTNDPYRALTTHARATQADIRAFLETRSAPFRPYYIVNMLAVEGDAQLAAALLARDDVERLEANPEIPQSVLSRTNTITNYSWARVINFRHAKATVDLPYGLKFAHADEVWNMGYTGQNIVVASQDTGVEWTHPALQPRYRGWDSENAVANHAYNWFDAWDIIGRPERCDSNPQIPCDDHGHGTHTVGTMLGNAHGIEPRVGMAPDAEWIGCRNMHNGIGSPGAYAACFEFFLAPYPQNGDPFTDGKPEMAPHIVNNSWSCPPDEGCDADTLEQVVATVRAAGQLVISSAGNEGNGGCNTVGNPIAIYDAVFSIGAHDSGGNLAAFSSRGPVTIDGSGRLKPDIAAPGVAVYSSSLYNSYQSSSGTSMASPHVAGAAALLWSAAPDLIGQIDLSEQVLMKSATPVPVSTCNADGAMIAPNQLYGYGRLNALKAVEMALSPAKVTVTLTQSDGQPYAYATVLLEDKVTGYRYSALSSTTGVATFQPIYAGEYTVALLTSDDQGNDVISELGGVEILIGEREVEIELEEALEMIVFLPFVAAFTFQPLED